LKKINLAGNTLPKEILEAPDVLSIKKIVESETGTMVDLNEYVGEGGGLGGGRREERREREEGGRGRKGRRGKRQNVKENF
jgi:hypothetical protein